MFRGCDLGFGRQKWLKDLLASIEPDVAPGTKPPSYSQSALVSIPEPKWFRRSSKSPFPESLVKDNGLLHLKEKNKSQAGALRLTFVFGNLNTKIATLAQLPCSTLAGVGRYNRVHTYGFPLAALWFCPPTEAQHFGQRAAFADF
jgi:hypothetical protein